MTIKADIRPVILCGGSGTRLWPLSRGLYPKQFMELDGSTLFEETIKRAMKLPGSRKPLIVCNQEHRFLAASLLQKHGLLGGANANTDKAAILLEPEGRNTAPAIAMAAFAAMEDGEDPLLLVLASDHSISPQEEFEKSVLLAASAAENGKLLTFGIKPGGPETGYGYIIHETRGDSGVFRIESFVEKPEKKRAEELLSGGRCFWNSGMFMFRPSVFLAELEKFSPDIYEAVKKAWVGRSADLDFIRPESEAFLSSPANSIDYAVMEHTGNGYVAPFFANWHDLGSWESFYETGAKDGNANSTTGDVLLMDSSGCYVHSTSRLVAGIGLKDLMVVETPDALLLLPKGRGQDVKKLLDELKSRGRAETNTHLKVYRPWGSYETLVLAPRFQVKRIIVKPGASLSLQMHHHRAEHWVVVCGTAQVLVDEREQVLSENMSVYIPLGARHRLVNPGHIDLEIIEIQSGSYLGEDDIVRFEDNYGRS